MRYFSLKIRSEPHIEIFKMAAPSSSGYCTIKSRLKSLAFSFSGENVTFLRDYDVITRNSLWNWGIPRFRSGTCVPIPYLEQTIPVLFKTSFKYRFHPPYPTSLTPPPLPHPLPPPFLPPPPCPFPQPVPPTIWSPLPKVNRQLKIVNYFTCMQHLFCRW